MQFTKATAHQSRLRLALIGPAGSGKTYTALAVAQHLGSKVAVIDTERGSASKYASLFGFDVLELTTFAPQTYVQAIQTADAAGYDVLVIDSLSHAWMGKDGALEMVDRAGKRSPSGNSFAAWRDVTPHHNAMVDAILACRAHVVVTLRSKTEYVQEKDERGKTVIRKVGLAPIQREGLDFEFDVCGDLDYEHTLVITKSRCPSVADAVIPKPGKELAEQLRAWLGQGEPAVVQPAQTSTPEPAPAPKPAVQATNGQTPTKPKIEHRQCACCYRTTECVDDGEAWICADAADCSLAQAALRDPVTDNADKFAADLKADLDKQQGADYMKPPTDWTEHDRVMGAPKAPTIRFPRNAPGMQEFIKLVELDRPNGLGLDADARKDALGGKTVNKYMVDQGWQDRPDALDRVWTLLEARVLTTEAAEVAATE